jgi:hypothetical protein
MERCESSTDSTHFICVDRPLACLITFSCYGSHLHGSENGSVDRDHNLISGRYLAPEPSLLRAKEERMRGRATHSMMQSVGLFWRDSSSMRAPGVDADRRARAVRYVVGEQGEPMAVYLNTLHDCRGSEETAFNLKRTGSHLRPAARYRNDTGPRFRVWRKAVCEHQHPSRNRAQDHAQNQDRPRRKPWSPDAS